MEQTSLIEEYLMPEEWKKVAEKILQDKKIGLVIGATDTGKSICTLLFANFWAKHGKKVGIVDIDMGQSDLGPPATMGMSVIDKPVNSFKEIIADALYFVGSTSPLNYFLPTICGAKKLVDEGVKKGAEIIILDTTGLVKGITGRTLKEYLIEIISPHYILALQKKDELEHILKNFILNEEISIYRMSPCDEVRRKIYFQRREKREEKFREYFKQSSPVDLNLKNLVIKGSYYGSGITLGEQDLGYLEKVLTAELIYAERIEEGVFVIIREKLPERFNDFLEMKRRFNTEKIIITDENKFKNLLVSLDDYQGFVVNLGIIQHFDFKRKILNIYSPLKNQDKVFSVKFGTIKIGLDGTELGKIFPREI